MGNNWQVLTDFIWDNDKNSFNDRWELIKHNLEIQEKQVEAKNLKPPKRAKNSTINFRTNLFNFDEDTPENRRFSVMNKASENSISKNSADKVRSDIPHAIHEDNEGIYRCIWES